MDVDARKALFLLAETGAYLAFVLRLMGFGASDWLIGPLAFAVIGLFVWHVRKLGRGQNHARK